MHFALHFICKKMHFPVRLYIQNTDTLRDMFICKKQFTLRYVYIYIIYRIVYNDT